MDGLMMRRHALLAANGLGKVDLTLTADTAPQSVTVTKKSRVRSCAVSFGPYQAGSGDPSPQNIRSIYGAQGCSVYVTGTNIFDGFLQGYYAFADGTYVKNNYWITSKKIRCKPNTYYTASAASKMTRYQGFVWYDASGNYISSKASDTAKNIGYTAQSPQNAQYLSFNIAGYPSSTDAITPSDVDEFQIEEGQSASSFKPYRSDTVSVTFPAMGRNLYKATYATTTVKEVTCTNNGDGSYTLNGTANGDVYFNIFTGTSLPSGSYRLSGCPSGGSTSTYYLYTYPTYSSDFGNGVNVTSAITSGSIFIKSGYVCDNLTFWPMIQLADGAVSQFEPYTNTIYGGTVDLVTGQGVVTSGIVTYNGTENWNLNSNGVFARNLDGSMKGNAKPGHCNILPVQTAFNATSKGVLLGGSATDGYVYVCGFQNEITSVADFKTFLSQNNMIIVYPLATPIPFTVPPQSMQNLPKGVSYAWATMERDVT